uniref:Uncharacterized protein n=1 Tax=Arundo donax TaxID=35708 RepID=A0A0A9GRC6_ARUDO
MRVSGLPPGRW